MTLWRRLFSATILCTALGAVPVSMTQAASAPAPAPAENQSVAGQQGVVEFRVGSSTSKVVAGARIIVILHDGKVFTTGLTDTSGRWSAKVPYYVVQWNERFSTKGVVNAIVVANGYNEQVVFVVPITAHTVQPVILQPIQPNARNLPSASLGNIHQHNLRNFVERYAELMGLTRQAPVPGDFGYAPWGPALKSDNKTQGTKP
ncbi:MAG: hypothetical protein OWT28_11265 [Firmicutes bacterium]|nr:hypothetical protein [Bacillota bacterium]